MIPTIVVFCGPSITSTEVRSELRALLAGDPEDRLVTLPPAAQGDVIEAVRRHRPHTIVIIDGVFERVPSVWHKEILWAMDGGVHVFGSSSMGALRAAELERFGMTGVGRIFELFRDGTLLDDDEVAVSHGTEDDDFRSLSTAMVDLRHHVALATEEGVIAPEQADALVRIAKALPYPQRSMPAVLRVAKDPDSPDAVPLSEAAHAWLRAAGRDRSKSRKRLDAIECLGAVALHLHANPAPFEPADWYVEPTMFLMSAISEIDQSLHVVPDDGPPTPRPDSTSADGSPDDTPLVGTSAAVLRKQALLRLLAQDVALTRGIRVDDDHARSVVANFRRRYGLETDAAFAQWLDDQGLEWPEVRSALVDVALVDRVEVAYKAQLDAAVAPLARFAAARRATSEAQRSTETTDGFVGEVSGWLQCNIGLAGGGASRRAAGRRLLARLAPVLDRLAPSDGLSGWFFQRKPPDVRLRIRHAGGDTSSSTIHRAIDVVVSRAAEHGLAESLSWSDYTPETERFGGTEAMALAHRHFTADSRLWLSAESALFADVGDETDEPLDHRPRVDAVFAMVIDRLVRRCAPASADRERTGRELAALSAGAAGDVRALLANGERQEAGATLGTWLAPAEQQALVSQAEELADRTAADLTATIERDPGIDRTRLVALLIHFSANRWGVDGRGQRWLGEALEVGPQFGDDP